MHLTKKQYYKKSKRSRNRIKKRKKKKDIGQQIFKWKLIPKDSLEVNRKRLRRQREEKLNRKKIVFLRRKRHKSLKKCKYCQKRVSSTETDLSGEASTISLDSNKDTRESN